MNEATKNFAVCGPGTNFLVGENRIAYQNFSEGNRMRIQMNFLRQGKKAIDITFPSKVEQEHFQCYLDLWNIREKIRYISMETKIGVKETSLSVQRTDNTTTILLKNPKTAAELYAAAVEFRDGYYFQQEIKNRDHFWFTMNEHENEGAELYASRKGFYFKFGDNTKFTVVFDVDDVPSTFSLD